VIGRGTEQAAAIERSGRRVPLLGAALVLLLLLWTLMTPAGFGAAQVGGWLAAVTPLALTAMAQTPVLLAGGQGLAAGGIAILASVVTARFAGTALDSALLAAAAAIAVGALAGAANGWLIARVGLRSTIVTLATGAAALALSLLLLDSNPPGPPDSFREFLAGDVVPGVLPAPAILLATVGLAWFMLDRSALGRGIRAAGRARAEGTTGAAARRPIFLAYLLGGAGYGFAGVYLAAQLGTPDPFTGGPTLLQIYAAVVLGGSVPGRRQGTIIGSLLGAAIVTTVDLILLSSGIDSYGAPALEAALLFFGAAIPRRRPAASSRSSVCEPDRSPLATGRVAWLAALAALTLLVVMQPGSLAPAALNELLMALLVMTIFALGQGCALLIGGIDLSAPIVATVAGLLVTYIAQQSDGRLLWAAPLTLGAATAAGALLGWAMGRLRLSPILGTLAMAGLLQALGVSATLHLAPSAAAPLMAWLAAPASRWPAPAVLLLLPCFLAIIGGLHRAGVVAVLRHHGTALAQHPCPPRIMALVYGGSSLLAALAGVLLAAYGGATQLGFVDVYLLPTLLALQLGGIAFGGGRGGLWGALGGVLFVTVFDTLLLGHGVSQPGRLAAVAGLLLVIAWRGVAPGEGEGRSPDGRTGGP
jgi:ribose transport system permease protein